jgi:aryl carrier-like protein
MDRTFVVGDVHGCVDELRALLRALAPRPDEHVVFCGDLVDKGPDSAGVVRLVRDLRDGGQRLTLVEGNHEAKHARFRRHERQRAETGAPNPVRGAEALGAITAQLDDRDIALLDTAVRFIRLPEHDAIVVHAGFPPSVVHLPEAHDLALLPKHERERYTQLLLVRHVGSGGHMVALGQEGPDDPFWTDVYDGRFGHAYFGHQPFMEAGPRRSRYATGLDLGCCFGNKLCAAVLTPDGAPEFVMVNANRRYAKGFWE